MNDYIFSDFIDKIKDLDLCEMIDVANRRCKQLEDMSFSVKGAVERRKRGSMELSRNIKDLLYWLSSGSRSVGLSDTDFQSLKILCVNLIEKKQLTPKALEVFPK